MPIYEFKCLKCSSHFEKLFVNSDEKVEMACPECRSESFERVISRTNLAMGAGSDGQQTQITTRSCGSPAVSTLPADQPSTYKVKRAPSNTQAT